MAKKTADMKVIILGDSGVGKTSLVCRYMKGSFSTQEPTIGAAFLLKQWGPYNVAIWDTAGEEKYKGLSKVYCRKARAAILAFDINDCSSFESLWASFVGLLSSAEDDCIRVVVGTKKDLVVGSSREITEEEGRKVAQDLNNHLDLSSLGRVPYFETSSLSGEGVKEVFEFIFQHCLPLPAEYQKQERRERQGSTINLHDTPPPKRAASKCAC